MEDHEKSREQLLKELKSLRHQLDSLKVPKYNSNTTYDMFNLDNEQYRHILENADDVIWLYDLERERFLYASPSLEKKFRVFL